MRQRRVTTEMRILYLVHRVPYPPNRGDRIRSYHLLRFLAEHAEVDLACLADEPVDSQQTVELGRLCRRVAIEQLGPGRWWRAARTLACGRSASEGLFDSPKLARTVSRWARETRYDRVVAFCSSMVPYLNLPELRDIPALVDLVDVDSQKWFDYAAGARGVKRRLFHWEGGRVQRLEQAAGRRASAVMLASGPEAEIYRALCPRADTRAVVNGVDLDYFGAVRGMASPGEAELSCVFVGALDYKANIDGVVWFSRHVWPELHMRYPAAVFSLVGRNPSPAVSRLADQPGIRVVGGVPDVRPYLAGAAVVVAPLQVARGIQNKVLEALAAGKAVVASPQALEGIDLIVDRHACRADSPSEWIDALSKLFNDGVLRGRLGAAGRQLVETDYAWTPRMKPWEQLLKVG